MLDVRISETSENEKVSCIIFDVDENLTLDTIRYRILKETKELLKGDYRFTVSGVPLSLAQEQTVLVSEAITSERGEPVIRYQLWYGEKQGPIYKSVPVETKWKDAQQVNNVNEEQGTSRKTTPEATSQSQRQRSALSMLKSPTTCSIKGIKLFSDKEIETSIGKEKERRTFWNRRASELCKEEPKKADLYKRIHEDWRIHKTDSMTKEVKDLSQLRPSKSTLKKGTLQSNLARVESAKQNITDLQEAIIKTDKHMVMELRKLRDELSSTRSELRKAQDALRKTTKKLDS